MRKKEWKPEEKICFTNNGNAKQIHYDKNEGAKCAHNRKTAISNTDTNPLNFSFILI